MLGVTISLNERSVETNYEYLESMREIGCNLVFTSLRIPEESPEKVKKNLEQLSEYIYQNFSNFVVDVSSKVFENFSIGWMQTNHITTLRIDSGIDESEIVDLSKNFKIIFNASTLTPEKIDNLKKLGFNKEFEAWHNYYPRKGTGLDENFFVQQNSQLKKSNVKIGSFISGDLNPRGTIYEWLPTLEKHRGISPFCNYLNMIYEYSIETVVLGDYGLTDKEKQKFLFFQKNNVVPLEVKNLRNKEILSVKMQNRIDIAQNAIRCPQIKEKMEEDIKPTNNTINRKYGDITLDNVFYGRYMGELQIILKSLEADARINVIGQVSSEDLSLLSLLKYKRLWFQFVEY